MAVYHVRMAKKKKVSGKHATPRKPVQMPADWLAVAQDMAADRKTPTVWFLIDLIRQEAEAAGKSPLPPVPWKPPKE